jgi:bifunctional DNA-binding transcriptional regulator/antitoxin component of YhaV-PrlF toxin-antitoxin module
MLVSWGKIGVYIKNKRLWRYGMKDFNTVKARHFMIVGDTLEIGAKDYFWHIPKVLRADNIKKGDVILVKARGDLVRVIVEDVLREEMEETGKSYNSVVKKLEESEVPRIYELMKDGSKVKYIDSHMKGKV